MPATKKTSKKTTTAKKISAVAKPSHPTYPVMVQEAIKALKERKGASRQAMKKYVMAEYNLSSLSVTRFNGALKKLTESGTLEQSKNGHRWSIAKAVTPKSPMAKKPAAKKPMIKKAAAKKVTKKVEKFMPRKQLATKAAR